MATTGTRCDGVVTNIVIGKATPGVAETVAYLGARRKTSLFHQCYGVFNITLPGIIPHIEVTSNNSKYEMSIPYCLELQCSREFLGFYASTQIDVVVDLELLIT